MQSYADAIAYLYDRLPMFTRDGSKAFKPDLSRTIAFCEALGHPENKFPSIHIAGTNGKGSSSHMIASVLQAAGYKTALYTSPHLVDFRERIRVDGQMIPASEVLEFVHKHKNLIESLQPSFFEVTVCMAFDYFAKMQVDIAVIEVGLGGRLDSTNIIRPLVSLITNIGLDHTDILGDSLALIAREKAGIIKPAVPVVIGQKQAETMAIFQQIASENNSPIYFAEEEFSLLGAQQQSAGLQVEVLAKDSKVSSRYTLDLRGIYQKKNLLGVLSMIKRLASLGFPIADQAIEKGLMSVQKVTGLMGRWQTLSTDPWIICDTGHNKDGIQTVLENLSHSDYQQLHIVIGAMKDKDIDPMLNLLPAQAKYYFSAPDMPRALASRSLAERAAQFNRIGAYYASVDQALQAAEAAYQPGDLIFIGGSTFVVAEVLTNRFS